VIRKASVLWKKLFQHCNQGDQIWQIFDPLRVVYFVQISWKLPTYRSRAILLGNFFPCTSYAIISTKIGTFGAMLHKLIWSPWLQCNMDMCDIFSGTSPVLPDFY
jgi:hypothetical protein